MTSTPATSVPARFVGLAAAVLALAALVVAPLHALARFATEFGSEDLDSPLVSTWAVPVADRLSGLLSFSDADTVYETYGKFWFVAAGVMLACALMVRRTRPRHPGLAERWGWRIALPGYALLSVGGFFSYWLLADIGFMLTVPGLLLSLLGSTSLGVGLLRARFRPVGTGVLLALHIPLTVVLTTVASQALGSWPIMLAWGAAGWSLWRHRGTAVQRHDVVHGRTHVG